MGSEVNVNVAVRVRPLLPREKLDGEECCVKVLPDNKQLIIGKEKSFTFDNSFSPRVLQGEIYSACVQPLIESLFEGYNATVFAYGQTSAGKTFTMGTCNQEDLIPEERGIIPRAVADLYSLINSKVSDVRRIAVRASYIEIYKEDIRDLFDLDRTDIRLREDEHGNTTVCGISEIDCSSKEDLLLCLETGSANRITGATQMNEVSSRSHCIFTVTVSQEWQDHVGKLLNKMPNSARSDVSQDEMSHSVSAKFTFVDLAGSERAHKTGNVGNRLKESIHINTGLLALGNVISALADPTKRKSHIPYRESKITRLLKDALGGTSKTLMICCISPTLSSYDESVNSLKYANRAKQIRNKPIVHRDKTSIQFEEMQSEIMALREELSRQRTLDTTDATQNSNVDREMVRLRMDCEHYTLLVKKASEQFKEFVDNNILSSLQNKKVRKWLDLYEELQNSVSVTLNTDDVENLTIKKLQKDLDKAKLDLANDEEIFAEKSKEVWNLEEKVKHLEAQLGAAGKKVLSLENQLIDRQEMLDKRQRLASVAISEDIVLEHDEDFIESERDPVTGRRVQSVPVGGQRVEKSFLSLSQHRPVKTSPALFSIDRVLKSFRARSELLYCQLEDEDEVVCRHFEDTGDDAASAAAGTSAFVRRGTYRLRKGDNKTNIPQPLPDTQMLSISSPPADVDVPVPDELKKQIKSSQMKLSEANQKIRDLSLNINMKEQLIKDLVKSSKHASVMNHKYEDRIKSLENEKQSTVQELQEVQRKLDELASSRRSGSSISNLSKLRTEYEAKLEEGRKHLQTLQHKLKDAEKLSNMTGGQEKRIVDLECALDKMRHDLSMAQKKVKAEADQKERLERQMQKEAERNAQLELKAEQQKKILRFKQEEIAAAHKKLRRGSGTDDEQKKWLDAEIEKVLAQKKQMEDLQDDLRKREDILAKKEALLSEKSHYEMLKLRESQMLMTNKEYLRMSAAIDDKERDIMEKQRKILEVPERNRNRVEEEIFLLKKDRDLLCAQRSDFEKDSDSTDEKSFTNLSRRVMEIDEAIEALDEAISIKNEAIRDKENTLQQSKLDISSSQENIFNRLDSLSARETKQMLLRYFEKLVDLKEMLRKTNSEYSSAALRVEELTAENDRLERLVEHKVSEVEHRLTKQQMEYENKIQLLLEQASDETQDSEQAHKLMQYEKELAVYKKTTRELKKKIREWVSSGRLLGANPADYGAEDRKSVNSRPPTEPPISVRVSRKEVRELSAEEVQRLSTAAGSVVYDSLDDPRDK